MRARQGHKDFITLSIKTVAQLGLAKDYRAYLALFDCWPDSRLLDFKQTQAKVQEIVAFTNLNIWKFVTD